MDFRKQCCTMGLLFIFLFSGVEAVGEDPPAEEPPAEGSESPEEGGLDFSPAISAVTGARDADGNIAYTTFCQSPLPERPSDQLLSCHIQSAAGFELRVCKLATGCQGLVNSSIENHDAVREAKLDVVKYSKEQIENLKCPEEDEGSEDETSCVGYVEQWISSTGATLIPFNQKVYDKQEDDMISTVISLQSTDEAKARTVTDLQKIIDFMTPPDGECTDYKQLCNLEGFFNPDGGFVIHNPSVKYKMMLNDYCHEEDNDPTNARVLEVLKKFVKRLEPESD